MIFVEVTLRCDTPDCGEQAKTVADRHLVAKTPPGWITIFMLRLEHYCPKHGAEAVARYRNANIEKRDPQHEIGEA
jgi:hypothetical protein